MGKYDEIRKPQTSKNKGLAVSYVHRSVFRIFENRIDFCTKRLYIRLSSIFVLPCCYLTADSNVHESVKSAQ